MSTTILGRFRQGIGIGVGLAVLVYVGYALVVGADEVAGALGAFAWEWLPVLLALSIVNYVIRFVRWEYYLRLLDIRVPLGTSAAIFLAGLAMTVTPGKVGEFLKSYLLKESQGIPMARSAPVVFAERLSDLLALVLLAAIGVAEYGGPKATPILAAAGIAIGAGILVLQSQGLTDTVLGIAGRAPGVAKVVPKISEAIDASRALLSWKPLVLGLLLSAVAWYAECAEYLLAFRGFGITTVEQGVAVFGYSFSTVAGVVSPGGLGPTDIGLIEIAQRFTPELEGQRDVATAASFIVRFCTLWFAVILGAIALMRFRRYVDVDVERARDAGAGESELGAAAGERDDGHGEPDVRADESLGAEEPAGAE